MKCPSCHGLGGEVEPVLDDGTGPWYDCGFCKGTGKIKDRKFFYQVLGWINSENRKHKGKFVDVYKRSNR